ncbi:MAG: hypothetical protein HOV76_32435 [Hamadaea sp.]|nr:hypothetical protein [Hamadaea sp.]
MPTTTRGFRYPASSAAPNVPQDIQNLASDVDSKTRIPVYSTIAARNTGIPSPYAGQQALVAGALHTYDGTTWRFLLTGTFSGSTDASGLFAFSHGAGQAPTSWGVTPGAQVSDTVNQLIQILAANSSSTTLTVRAVRTDTNAYFAANPISGNYWAKF